MLTLLLQAATDPGAQDFISGLFQRYGVMGLAFGVLLFLILRQNKSLQKRVEDLEKSQQAQHVAHLETHKQMIADYVELVRNKTKVLADLTGCLNAIKDTLERLERGQQK